ncbi:MAG: peptide deformylase [Desulfohalobiaceae bacterium]|nr:peptide deformylase [Desulfohalobiaceae bacterium]
MAREIKTYPDPVLKKKGREIEKITENIKDLAQEMVETMYQNQGIGLAAPQVGESLRLITVDVSGPDFREDLHVLINPELIELDGETCTEEGCLSLPGFKCRVTRAEEVTVKGLAPDGTEKVIQATGLLAVCLQHEIDHLNGKVLLDYSGRMKKIMYEKKATKRKEE